MTRVVQDVSDRLGFVQKLNDEFVILMYRMCRYGKRTSGTGHIISPLWCAALTDAQLSLLEVIDGVLADGEMADGAIQRSFAGFSNAYHWDAAYRAIFNGLNFAFVLDKCEPDGRYKVQSFVDEKLVTTPWCNATCDHSEFVTRMQLQVRCSELNLFCGKKLIEPVR